MNGVASVNGLSTSMISGLTNLNDHRMEQIIRLPGLGLAVLAGSILLLGTMSADAACRWTQRAGAPYIACDPGPAALNPPNKPAWQPSPAPDVQPAPLAEAPLQPPIAGTPAPPLAPAPPLGLSIGPESLSRSPLRPSPPPPTLNPGAPGLLAPRGGPPALPGAR